MSFKTGSGHEGSVERVAAFYQPMRRAATGGGIRAGARSVMAGGRLRRAFGWCFRSRTTGLITIGQLPNAPLIVFLVARIGAALADEGGRLRAALMVVADLALAIWALDEVVRGVNPWRRVLGAGVLVFLAFGRLA